MLGLGLTVYLRLRKNWLSVQVVSRRDETVQLDGMACVAVRLYNQGKTEIVAIGEEAGVFANMPGVTVYHAFCHPRVLIGGFDNAQLVTREFLRRACGGKKPLLGFSLVIQVLDELEGGLTDVEERALKELGLRLGANNVTVLPGPSERTIE